MVGVAKVDSAGEMCQKRRVSLRVKPEMREAFCRTRRLRCWHPRVWVVGDHLCGVNVSDTGCAASTAGAEGELGLSERLVMDEECEGFPGPKGSDEELGIRTPV